MGRRRRNRFKAAGLGQAAPVTAGIAADADDATARQRALQAADARLYREALDEGRMLWRIPLGAILTTGLPRDRIDLDGVARAEEMAELKASIRAHGQREPIELFRDGDGRLQLKTGWRRLTALRALMEETGDETFGLVLARIDNTQVTGRLPRYVDMVEENILRQDLTFAEMAQLAIEAARDPGIDGDVPEDLVLSLYGTLHKTKRYAIRNFVAVLRALGDALPFPKAVGRDLGSAVARALRERPGLAGSLRAALAGCGDADAQNAALRAALTAGPVAEKPAPARDRPTVEFRIGTARITARKGEFRIRALTDFSVVPRARLEAAVAAFHDALGTP